MSSFPNDPAPNPAMVRRRPASVTLREGAVQGPSADTANQALGDALKVVYRFLQVGMVILIGVFLLSGLQSVKEGERGVLVSLGRVVDDGLEPGFHISLPQPLGEILKFNTGNQTLDISGEFWPAGSAQDRFKEDAVLANSARPKLDPVSDGFLLTGDLSIGHVVARVEYKRDPAQIRDFAKRIHPDSEQKFVRSAVMQGLVRASAGRTIDQFRKENSLQEEAQRHAQKTLDSIGSGLQLTTLVLQRRMVPPALFKTFGEVEASLSNANKLISEAEQFRQATLASTAGDVAEELLTLVEQYDREYTAGKSVESDATLAKIAAILEGQPVGDSGKRIAGKASQILAEAKSERARTLSQSQANAALFKAKYEAFKTNPGVVLVGDWSDAFTRFVSRDTVQVFMIPPTTTTLDMLINRDPDLQKEQEALLAKRAQEENFKRQLKEEENRRLNAAPAQPQ